MQDLNAITTKARIAGFLYIVVILASVFSLVSTQGLISADASQTAANIKAAEPIFRLSFVALLISGAAYVGVVAILYDVMKPAGPTLSTFAAFFGLAGCAVSGLAMLNQINTLSYLSDAAYLGAFEPGQLNALARLSLRTASLGNSLALAFFGCYCLSLSALVLRSAFLPSILAALLAIAGLGWLVNSFSSFLAPSLGARLAIPSMAAAGLSETLFCLWILVMGVNAAKWREQAELA